MQIKVHLEITLVNLNYLVVMNFRFCDFENYIDSDNNFYDDIYIY